MIYLPSNQAARARCVERLLAAKPVISVHGLDTVTEACITKGRMTWSEVDEFVRALRGLCEIVPLTEAIHDKARAIAERHGLAFQHACVAATAVLAECATLYTEDLGDGRRVDAGLIVRAPFARPG